MNEHPERDDHGEDRPDEPSVWPEADDDASPDLPPASEQPPSDPTPPVEAPGTAAGTPETGATHEAGGAVPPPPPPPTGFTPPPGAGGVSHSSGLSSESRNWAMGAHLSALGAWLVAMPVVLGFAGPLVIWLLRRDHDSYVDYHGKEALNFNISFLIYMVAAGISILVLVGVVLVPAVLLTWTVLSVVAAVKAANGEAYRYPLTIRFVS